MSASTRSIEKRIKIRATAREVWAALTDAEDLVRWFPNRAKVEPGVGGSILFSWDGSFESTARIDVWEPERRLVLHRDLAVPGCGPLEILEDWTIEPKGGFTRVSLVHSGFPEGPSWDAWFEGTSRGWDFELRGLRHYLQRHPGMSRDVIWCRRGFEGPLDLAWNRIMGREGFVHEGAPGEVQNGDRVELVTATGDHLSGCLQLHGPPLDFAMVVEEMDDAYLRLRLDPPGVSSPRAQINLWLSTYGVDVDRRAYLRTSFEELLDTAFPQREAAGG